MENETASNSSTNAAASWSLYDGYATSVTIPYAPGSAITSNPTGTPKVAISVAGTAAHNYTIDTGSLGMLVPAADLPGVDLTGLPDGEIGYGSSGYSFTGKWLQTTIAFTDSNGANITEMLPVLVIQHSYLAGVLQPNYGGPHQLGVGFADPKTDRKGVVLDTANNAFLNLASMKDGKMRPGYVLGADGVQLGLTGANAAMGWAYSELTLRSGTTLNPNGANDWERASTVLTVNGVTSRGTELVDTGLGHGQIGYPGAPTRAAGASGPVSIPTGTEFRNDLLGIGDNAVSYGFTLGDNNSQTPEGATSDGQSTYLNTTYHLLAGLDYLYDAQGGFIGFKPNATGANTQIQFTSELAAGGTMTLTEPVSLNLPVTLRDQTTIVSDSAVNFSQAIGGGGGLILTGGGTFTLLAPGTASGGITLDNARLLLDTPGAAGSDAIVTAAASRNLIAVRSGALNLVAAGNDTVFAGDGAASIRGGSRLTFVGAAGLESVDGSAGSVTAFGGDGGLLAGGHAGDNLLVSRSGNTTLVGGGGGDQLFGAGHDVLAAETQGETLVGGSGSTLIGADGAALFSAGGPIFGTKSGTDSIVTGDAASTVVGRNGHDAVYAGAAPVAVWAGAGVMSVVGGSGGGTVSLGSGETVLVSGLGGESLDVVAGQAGGRATIFGIQPGRDQLCLFGYDPASVHVQNVGGSTSLLLMDGSSITLSGFDASPGDLARLLKFG